MAAPTKAQKILHRTRVGAGLAVAVAGLLWVSSTRYGEQITLLAALVLTVWSLVEVERMGILRTKLALGGTVIAAALAAFLVHRGWMQTGPVGLLEMLGVQSDFLDAPRRVSHWAQLLIVAGAALIVGAVTTLAAGRRVEGDSVSLSPLRVTFLVAMPLLFLGSIRSIGGTPALAGFLVLAKVGDVAGYYFGNLLGKRKPFPNISPGKTVEGCTASLIAGMLVGALLVMGEVLPDPRYGVLSGLVLGAIVNVTAQAGDLMESWMKRRSGVKDSGTFFGPSGGMLDLVDSLLLSAPLIAVIWPLLFHWLPWPSGSAH